ncbi:MAG: bifunctional DNA-formamidopyrimidine glycosylase/DNA-(apurinic or apyrimidinic site) lyase [Silvanigrellaceae bacterium]|nr:bifunctional DNA-formamidopyrimidine glycosylase/DNA-(apurinic or apyrimidinic site) lyase [Silvanigrellaceae bacterium]
MPELPEVQSFVNAINQSYAGRKLSGIEFHRKNLRYPFEKIELKDIFSRGTIFHGCQRQGKQLLLKTERGDVSVSLGMSGAFVPKPSSSKPNKHEHVTLLFEEGNHLGYEDPRRFGFWKVSPKGPTTDHCVPVDALEQKELLQLFLSKKISTKKASIKAVLMDQHFIGGIGNIYALEALHRANIHPLKLCSQLSQIDCQKLAKEIPKILFKAIELGGSSVSTYRTLHGEHGNFQKLHLVYGREGESCLTKGCLGVVERLLQNGRSSFYCPHCQK